MSFSTSSPVSMSLDRQGSSAAVLVRADVWLPAGLNWQRAGSLLFQSIKDDREAQTLTLATGDYQVKVTISVGEDKTSGPYLYAFSVGDQQAVVDSGTIDPASAPDDGEVFSAEFSLTVA